MRAVDRLWHTGGYTREAAFNSTLVNIKTVLIETMPIQPNDELIVPGALVRYFPAGRTRVEDGFAFLPQIFGNV